MPDEAAQLETGSRFRHLWSGHQSRVGRVPTDCSTFSAATLCLCPIEASVVVMGLGLQGGSCAHA